MNIGDPSETIRRLAREILSLERDRISLAEPNGEAAHRVCDALRRPLSTLAGLTGFRELLKRALVLARRKVPSLSAVDVGIDGSLNGLTDDILRQSAGAEVVLVSELLELLAVLIGEDLTTRIVLDIWPGLNNIIGEATEHGPRG